MSKYIINEQVMGCETVGITDEKLLQDVNNQIYLVLNEKANESGSLATYYEKVKAILQKQIKLYLIMVADEQKIRGPLCNLMALYGNYNVYKVPEDNFISSAYLDTLPQRKVTYDELAQYVQTDIAAYNDMDTVLSGVQDCVSRDDVDGLKTLVETHMPTFEAAPTVFSNMKVSIDQSNSGVWQDKLKQVREQLSAATDNLDTKIAEIKEKDQQIDDLKQSLKDANRQLTQSKADLDEIKAQQSSAGPAIRNYQTVKTQLIRCKTENIIYIKEISSIPYIKSFVVMLQRMIQQFKYSTKLIIYDNSTATQLTYGNMQQVDQAAFEANKQQLLQRADAFVVTEPAPQILKDILQSMSPQIDVVIIYDKLHQAADIVEGNNVYKFWIINSKQDYMTTKGLFKIDMTQQIITRPGQSIAVDVIDIPKIKNYELEQSDNGKFTKYKGVQQVVTKKPLMQTFLQTCNIQRKSMM